MIPPDGKVIGTIGCGGAATEELVMEGREVHGAEFRPRRQVARERLTAPGSFTTEERPFDDPSLDGLILADVLEHLPLAWQALRSSVEP